MKRCSGWGTRNSERSLIPFSDQCSQPEDVCMLKSHMGSESKDDDGLIQKCTDIVHLAAALLEKCRFIKYERPFGRLQSTELGRIASHSYVTHNSIVIYNQHLRPTVSTLEIVPSLRALKQIQVTSLE